MAYSQYQKITMPLLISFSLGILSFFIVLSPNILNPTNTNWLFSGDPAGVYLGWVFYRNSEWTMPIGLIPKYGVGLDTSLVYVDSIPIMAYIFKLLSPIIPEKFQYFGYWYFIIFILQSYFGWKLSTFVSKNNIIGSIFITLLFVFSPAMIAIVGYWPSETSHFLILFAIFLILRKDQSYSLVLWTLLLVLSVSICFYIFVTVGAMWLANLLDKLIFRKTINFKAFILSALIAVLFTSIAAWQAGYFQIIANGNNVNFKSIAGYGYGVIGYSFDLLSPFYYPNWSYLLRGIPRELAPNYSFNFLGLGLIFGSFIFLLRSHLCIVHFSKFFRANKFLFFTLCLLMLVGISNTIRLGPIVIEIPLPDKIYSIASILRSSHRLVWPLYYFFIFAIFYILYKSFTLKIANIIVSTLFLIQIVDTSAGWLIIRSISATTSTPNFVNTLKDPFWELPQISRYDNLLRVPLEGPKDDLGAWEIFGHYAGDHKMGLNLVALARENQERKWGLNNELDKSIASGNYDPRSIYVLDDTHVLPASRHIKTNTDLFAKFDGFNVIAPGWNTCSDCPKISSDKLIIPSPIVVPALDKPFYFGKDGIGVPYLLSIGQSERIGWGWSYPETWGVWSEGYQAKLVIPFPQGFSPRKLTLNTTAFVTKNHPKQKIEILINRIPYTTITFDSESSNLIEIYLPRGGKKDYVLVEFQLPSAASPKSLNINNDVRKLGIGLVSGIFSE